jgi:predicted nucleic acid-binding protein
VARLVLTDASPLIGLGIVGGLPWLRTLFGEVRMPITVRDEVLGGPVTRGQEDIRAALAAGCGLRLWHRPVSPADVPDLDEGESACIGIALAQSER